VLAESLSKRFDHKRVLDGITLTVAPGEFFSVLGPSGCGKTTALRIIAGLDRPDHGRVLINGTDVTRTPPHRRPTNLVFQQGALFPHMNVFANVAFGLRCERLGRAETGRRVEEILDVVGMAEYAGRPPSTLSGGQRQRVAIARALVKRPDVLLLDEPLSALDLGLQLRMRRELRRLQQQTGTAFVCVTHNQAEAMEISDRIAVVNDGRVEQTGTARDLYRAPASRFVAEFIGETNLFEARVAPAPAARSAADRKAPAPAGLMTAHADGLEFPAPPAVGTGHRLLAVRPEGVRVVPVDDPASAGTAVVRSAGFLGARVRMVLESSTGREILVDAGGTGGAAMVGDRVGVAVDAERVAVVPDSADAEHRTRAS
jgi:ABC-type Fe3+/spermidine/putrescine transport system ATPase subunit